MLKIRIVPVVFCVLSVVACNNNKKSQDISQEPERRGTALEPVAINYSDTRPSLSADGVHVVFISGRSSTPTVPTTKAYKADWPSGEAPSAPARVTLTDDLGLERDALISPDGAWVVVTLSNGDRIDLYAQEYGGTRAVRLTDDDLQESRVSFSPDSKMLAFMARDPVKDTAVAHLVAFSDIIDAIASGGTAALADKIKTVSPATDDIKDLFFVPTGTDGSYSLALGKASDQKIGVTLDFTTIAFTATADAATATPAAWRSKVPVDVTIDPAISETKIALVERVGRVAPKVSPSLGIPDSPLPSNVISQVVFSPVAGGDTTQTFATPPGYETLSVGLTQDGTTGFELSRVGYRCDISLAYSFATVLSLGPSDGSAVSYVIPRLLQDGKTFEVADTICPAVRADNTNGRLDTKMTSIVVNGNAAAAKYRALYVTRFTTAFDENCELKIGDPEIMALDIDGSSHKIYGVSNNLAPIANNDRGTAGACTL